MTVEETILGIQIINNNNDNNNNNNNINNNSNQPPTTIAAVTTTTTTTMITTPTAMTATTATTTTAMKAITTNDIAPIELTENFYINNRRKNNIKIQVKLSGSGIHFRRETEQQTKNIINEQLLRIEDIIGSRFGSRLKKRVRGGLSSCKRNLQTEEENEGNENDCTDEAVREGNNLSQHQHKDTSAYLYIYAYIKSEKLNALRHRTVRILRFRSFDRFEENLKCAENWYRGIRINKNLKCRSSAATALMASATADGDAGLKTKPLLILLNPKSGSGKSRELFQKQVVPILKEAEAHYELHITTHANHARELVRSRKDIENCYSGIVVASGDGLFFEVLNGLMERIDWRTVCNKLPIGIIPCGSGNGLAKSIAHLYNESYEKPIMLAALTCVSGHTAPMDIVRVELANKSGTKPIEMYSFLSVGWGLIADIDIESERLRSIGAQRFTLWTIHRLISLRTYKGKLSYLRWVLKENVISSENEKKREKETENATMEEQPEIFYEAENGFHDALDDMDIFADATSLDLRHVDSWHSAASKHTAYYSIAGQSIRSKRTLNPSIFSKLETTNGDFESRIANPPMATIPALNMPLPDQTWSHEDGEFIMVHAAYTTHLATDCLFAPESRLNDGIIYLVIIRAGCSRSQLLQFLLGMSSGTHIPCTPNEHIEIIPVRAFRIEPHSGDDGIMAVDGERVDYGSIQAEIFPGIINVMVPSG